MVYSNTAVYGGSEYGTRKSGHLSNFTFSEALSDAFEVQFFPGFHFYTY